MAEISRTGWCSDVFEPIAVIAERMKRTPSTVVPFARSIGERLAANPDLEVTAMDEAEPVKAAAPRISRHINDLIANPTPVRWLRKHELERGTIVVFAGEFGAFKSTYALDHVGHVAVKLREPVLWCTAEGTGASNRFKAWLLEYAPGVDPSTVPLRVVERRYDLSHPGQMDLVTAELTAMAAEFGKAPALCVIDTYTKYTGGLDENDNSQAKAFLGDVDLKLRRPFGCTVVIVAHVGVSDKTRVRGAYALTADSDAFHLVAKEGTTVRVTRGRFKDYRELEDLCLAVKVRDLGYKDDEGDAVTACVLVRTDYVAKNNKTAGRETVNQSKLLEALRSFTEIDVPEADVIKAALPLTGVDMHDGAAVKTKRKALKDTVNGMVSKGRLHRKAAGYVSLTTATEPTEDPFK